jgi:hypothetical protein
MDKAELAGIKQTWLDMLSAAQEILDSAGYDSHTAADALQMLEIMTRGEDE